MKKSIGSHISSRLRNLSKAELDAVAKQVLIILERAVVAGFISDDEKLYLELNKLCPTKMSVVVTDDLSIDVYKRQAHQQRHLDLEQCHGSNRSNFNC